MTLFEQISQDITAAMKAKDRVRLDALRNVKKLFLEAQTAPGANGQLADADALKILAKMAKQGKDAAQIFQEQNRPDLAEGERAQVAVFEEYLPKQLTEGELTEALRALIAQVGASGPQDMGKVMGLATKQLAGRAEGRAISAAVKALLS